MLNDGEKESEDFGYSHPSVPVARHSGGGISGWRESKSGCRDHAFSGQRRRKNE